MKDVIFQGDLFRLVDPKKNDYAALMYATKSKSKVVLFAYLVGNRNGDGSRLRLEGLDESKNYKVRELNLHPGTKSALKEDQVYSGEYLMTVGFNPVVNARRTSVVLEIEAM